MTTETYGSTCLEKADEGIYRCRNTGKVIRTSILPIVCCGPDAVATVQGPGDYLHLAILRWAGEGPTRKCTCKDRIAKMNKWGPAVCREHLDTIIDWMIEEASKRGWWRYTVAVPRSRLFIKRMVLGAIKKAESAQDAV